MPRESMHSFFSCEDLLQGLDLDKLRTMAGSFALKPCVAGALFGFTQTLQQCLLGRIGRVHSFFPDPLHPDSFHEVVSAFQIVRTFSVVLKEKSSSLQRLLGGFDRDQ